MDGKLLDVEVTQEFKSVLKRNTEDVFGILDKREYFLSLCDDILLHYYYLLDGVQEDVERARDFIKNQAKQKLENARAQAIVFAQAVSERFDLGEIKQEKDIAVPQIEYCCVEYKKIKEQLKSYVLMTRSESRKIIKESKKLFNNRALLLSDNNSTEEYADSVNFQYVVGLNNIFGLSGDYSEVADMVIDIARQRKQIDCNEEMGEE